MHLKISNTKKNRFLSKKKNKLQKNLIEKNFFNNNKNISKITKKNFH